MDTEDGNKPIYGPALFLNSARSGDNTTLEECVRIGNVDINTTNANGLTALHLASKEGHVDTIVLLLKLGADYSAASKKGNTPLHTAALAGKADVVRVLIQAGSNVNIQSQHGFTPLYMAAQENHVNVVRLLLAHNARQDLATEDGYTPLAVAVQQGHDGVVSLLVGSGETTSGGPSRTRSKTSIATPTGTMAGLRDRTAQRPPPLHIAARKDDVQAAENILRNATNNAQSSQKWALLHESTKSGFTALHVASRYGNQRVTGLLIEHGADVNFTAKNAVTPLHVASKWGHQNLVRLLLNMGARIEAKTGDDLTPLHCAARSGHDTAIVVLLERGALVSARSRSGLTPLHMTAQGDHVECASILLNRGAKIDDTTLDSLTPLHIVAHYGHVRTAKMLVDNNCNINALAPNGFTPLHIACKKNHLKVVELLLRHGAPIEAATESGLTPLHVASFVGNDNLVTFLLQRGANPNSVTHRGETPLHFAARARRIPIMTQLLDHGAQPDAKSKDMHTALHVSARQGDAAAVRLLLQRGASPNSVTSDLNTPMHGAAREGHAEVVDILDNNAANKTALNKRGFSPLHMAAKFGKFKVAKLLLDRGVNPNIEGKYSLTPLHVATHYGSNEVALHLLERQAKPQCAAKNGYTPLHIASKRNRREIAGTLLKYGANPNAESVNGYSPLHLASSGGLAEIATMLLDDDAQPNCRSKNGLAPMHLCAQEDMVNVAEILEKNGAEIDPQTKAGYTPLHTACHFGQVNMIQFLLRHGASVQATTKMGYTPLHQAAQQGQVVVIKILLKQKADPNALTASGQTALSIAESLGIDPVVDILKNITDVIVSPAVKKRKLNMAMPELMQEAPMSDWEDEAQSPLATITEEMEPTDSSILRTPAGLQLTPRFGSSDIPMEGNILDSPSDGCWTLPAKLKSKSREISPPRDLQLIREGNPRWTWSDDAFGDGTPNGKGDFGSSTVSLGPSQIMKELQYMRNDRTHPSDDIVCESPLASTPQITDEEFFTPQSIQLQASAPRMRPLPSVIPQPSENDSSKPTLGAIIGKNGGVVNHPQKVRVIIPPGALSGPTKITCRLVSRDRLSHPPPLKQAESLASRVVEMGPPGLKFLKPVIVEVPHFASLRGGEREISVKRSDGGRLWKDTTPPKDAECELDRRKAVQEVLKAIDTEPSSKEEIRWDRVTHIHTSDLPHYFAIVSRVHQQIQTFGPQGGTVKSSIDPTVSVIIPPGSLSKNTPVNIEVQPVPREVMSDLLGISAPAVSPLVSVEPQDGAFTKPVTVSVPCPSIALRPDGQTPTKLRLIAGTTEMGDGPVCWKDITDAVPMSPTSSGVSFTPDLAAIRFMVLACPPGCMPNKPDAEQLAGAVYREASTAPFLAKFIVFAKRTSLTEGQLKIFCVVIDDDDVAKLVDEEGFEEVARSSDIEVLEGKPQFIELTGNLRPLIESKQEAIGLTFEPFKKNILPLDVQIMDIGKDPTCLVSVTRSPLGKGPEDTQQTPTCTLNAQLPEIPGSHRYSRQQNPAGDDEYLLPDSDQPRKVEWPCFDEDPSDNALPLGVAYAAKVLSKQPSPAPDEVEESLSEPVYAAPAASAPRQPRRVEGELQSKSEQVEDQSVLEDGSTVKRQVVTTTYFRPVTEWPADSKDDTFGHTPAPVKYEETVSIEVDENLVKLPPGLVEPFGKNASVDVTTETCDDVFADGVPVHITVRTMNVKLSRAAELSNGLDATDKTIRVPQNLQRPKSPIARMDDLLKSATGEVPSAKSNDFAATHPGSRTRLGDTELRNDVEENEHTVPDGTTVKHKITTTRYVAPLFQVTSVGNKEVERLVGEQLLKTNIEEVVTRLPAGIIFPFGTNIEVGTYIETEASEELSQDISPDGSPINKKLVNVTVTKVLPDASWAWDTEKSLDAIGANVLPSVHKPIAVVKTAKPKRSPSVSKADKPNQKPPHQLGDQQLTSTLTPGRGMAALLADVEGTTDAVPWVTDVNDADRAEAEECETFPVTTVKEYRRGHKDGSVVVHRVKTTHHVEQVPPNAVGAPANDVGEVLKGRSLAVEVEETIFKLPPGVIEPDGLNVQCEIKVKNSCEQTAHEAPIQRKLTVVDVHLKPAESELQCKEYCTEERADVADGTVVVKKTKTTEYFKNVKEFVFNGSQDSIRVHEESVKFDVVENVLELHPGCVEPFGSNVSTNVTVNKVSEVTAKGLPVKKKIVKLVVEMKDELTKQRDEKSNKFTLPKSEPDKTTKKPRPGRFAGTEIVEGPVQVKTEVQEDEPRTLENGATLKHKTVTDTFFKPVQEIANVNGRPQVLSAQEKLVGKEIEESFIELPKGIVDPCGQHLESVTSIRNLDNPDVDGVPVSRKISYTKVNRTTPTSPSDEEIMKHVKEATLDDIIPLMQATKQEMLNPSRAGDTVETNENETKPDTVEYHRCLDDGTIVRYVATTTKSPAQINNAASTLPLIKTPTDGGKSPVETEVDVNVIALPTGLIKPLAANCDASVVVRTFEKPGDDGTKVKVSVAAAVIAPKRRRVEGDEQSRVKLSEDKTNLDSGISVLKKIKTVEFFKPMKEIFTNNGMETEVEVEEIPVRYEITENIVELHPGCVQPFGRNVSTDVTVEKNDDRFVNGVPAKKKTVKLIVRLKEKQSTPGTASTGEVPAVPKLGVKTTASPTSPIKRGPGIYPGSQVVEEPVEARTETVSDKPLPMDDGGVLKHQTVTVTYVKPIKDVAIVNGQRQVLAEREEIVGKEVDESFIELPQGVKDPFGKNLESITSVEKPDDVEIDGVLVKRKISRTKVSKVLPNSPSDDEIIKHVQDGTLDEIIPIVSPELEARMPSKSETNPDETGETGLAARKPFDLLEYHRCLDDGTVLRRIVAPSPQPVEVINPIPGSSDSSSNAPAPLEVDEYVLALPSGVLKPNSENRDAAIYVQEENKTDNDGNPVLVSIATVVVSPKKGFPDKKIVEGDVQSKVTWSESKFNTIDGVNVVRKIKTTKFFKPMQEITTIDGVQISAETYEAPVRNEVTENVLELHPGCVEPYGSNVITTVSVGPWDESIEKTIPTRTKVVKLTVVMKDKSTSPLDVVTLPCSLKPIAKIPADGKEPAKEIFEGPIELRTETFEDKPLPLADGGVLLHKTATATRVKPIKEVTNIDGCAKVIAVREEIIDREIYESFVELPRGVKQQYGKHLQSLTSTEKMDDAVVDGVLVKKKITRTKVSRTQRDSPTDNEIRKHVNEGTLDEVIPVTFAKVESALPFEENPTIADDGKIEPTLVEYQRCLDDGTVLRRLMAVEKQAVPVEEGELVAPDTDEAIAEPPLEVVVYDNVLALAPGSIEPNGDSHDASIDVKNLEKPMIDETPAKVVAVTAVVSPKGEDLLARRTVEGDVQSRTSWSEDVTVTDDGTKVTRNIKTTEFFKPVKDVVRSFGIESELQSREEPVLFKNSENILEMHPGCVDMYGSNVSTDITVNRSNEVLPSGVPMTTKVVRVAVRLDGDKQAAKTPQIFDSFSSNVGKDPAARKGATSTVEDPVDSRREVIADKPRLLSSGGTVSRQTVNIVHFKLVKEIAETSEGPQVLSAREVIVGREINDVFVELPRGVESAFGKNLESITKVENFDDAVVDGVPVKRKITKTKVVRANPQILADRDILRSIKDGTPDDAVPLTSPKMESEPFIRSVINAAVHSSPSSQPEVLEYHRSLDDGTVIHRVAAATKREIPPEQVGAVKPKDAKMKMQVPCFEKDVDDCILALPPGVVEPSGTNCDTSITVRNFDKSESDGVPVNVSVSTAIISRTDEGDEITRKTAEDDLQSKTTWSEDTFITDDGINIVRKTKTTHFFRPVHDVVDSKGIKIEHEVREESVKYDVVENILQLHPGCVEPFGSNVRTKVNVSKHDGTHESGVPLKKKVVKLVVTLDTEKEESKSSVENKKNKPVDHAVPMRPTSAKKGVHERSGPGIQIIEEPTESRTTVKEDQQPLINGGRLKHRTVSTVRVKPIKEVAVINGQQQVLSSREEIVDREVDETFIELPPGVTEECGKNLESVTSVEHLDDTVVDGVLVKKTVTRTLVKQVEPDSVSDDEIRQHLVSGTLDEILPIDVPKSVLVDPKGQPDVVEFHRCLDDGTVVRRVVATTKCPVSEDQVDVLGSTLSGVPSSPHIEVEVDESILVLPPGVIRPEHDNCDVSVVVKNFVKPDDDGTLVKTSVATATISPKDLTKQTIEGELQWRTTWSEDKSNRSDGASVLTKTKSVEFFKPVTELSFIDGKEVSSATTEVTVRFEILENVVELFPGCVEPYGSNVSTEMFIDNSEDTLPNGIPVKRRVVKLSVQLKKESGTSPAENGQQPVVEETPQKKEDVELVTRRPGSGRLPGSEIIEEPVESRVEVEDDQLPLDDGSTIKYRIKTVTRVKPIKEVMVVQGRPQVLASREEIVDREIEEHFVELPPGVTEQFGKNLEFVSSVERPSDVVVDGVLVKRKTTKTKVRLVGVGSPSDDDILQHINDGTLDQIVPLVLPKEPEVDISMSQPNVLEYQRCLEDGTVVRRVVATKTCAVPSDEGDNQAPGGEVCEPSIEIQVDESVLALPPGTVEPQLNNVDATMTVRNIDKIGDDGVAIKTIVTTTVIAPNRVPDGSRTIEGPIETRRQVEENRRSLDDGTTIKTKIITTRRVRSVTELVVTDGVETVSDIREDTVGVEVEEHILELPAGVIEPSAANCDTDITVHQSDDHRLADGTLAKLKVVRMIVRLKDQPAKSPQVQSVEGAVVQRPDVRETERTLPDGTVVRTRVATTRQLRPITEVTTIDGVPTVTGYREQVIDASVDEDVVRLGVGVVEPVDDDPTVHVTRDEPTTRQTVLPDGTRATTTTRTTSYWKDPVVEKKPPSVTHRFVEGAIESKTNVDDECTTRPDGSTVHRRTTTTRLVKPVRVVTHTDGEVTDTVLREELVGTDVEERIIELPPGVVDVNDRTVRTTRTEQNLDETMPDGSPLRRKVICIVGRKVVPEFTPTLTKSKRLVTRKMRRIGSDGELIEDFVTVEEDDDGASIGSTTSSRRSSISDPAGGMLSPNDEGEPLSPTTSELDLVGAVGVFADVIELEPTIDTDVQEFDDVVLPDSTAVRKRVVTTTERRTIVMRALLPTDDDDMPDTAAAEEAVDGDRSRRAGSPIVRYVDVTRSEPETVSDLCERTETLPNGQLVKRRVRTTGQRQVTTERTLLTGHLDDDHFRSHGVMDRSTMTPTSEKMLSPETTRRLFRTYTSSAASGDEQTSRLVLRRHIHKKTILQGDKEETLITETTHVEQDSDTPPDLSASIQQVIEQFMSSHDQCAGTSAIEAPSTRSSDEAGTASSTVQSEVDDLTEQ